MYAVGTQIETWQDASRSEDFTDDPDDLRRIVVQYWYPALPTNAPAPLAYITEPDVRMPAFAKSMDCPNSYVNHIRDVQTHSLLDAPPHPDADDNLPLIVFSHGLGGMKTQNSIQAEELASRGYVVIAADHAYDAFLTLFDDGTTADYRSSGRGMASMTEEEFSGRPEDLNWLLEPLTWSFASMSSLRHKIARRLCDKPRALTRLCARGPQP